MNGRGSVSGVPGGAGWGDAPGGGDVNGTRRAGPGGAVGFLARYSPPARLAIATLVAGAIAGGLAAILILCFHAVEWLAFGYVESTTVPGALGAPGWRRIVSLVVVGFVAAVVWWLLRRPHRDGRQSARVVSVEQAVSGQRMPWWSTIIHALLQFVIVAGGASIGRETAPRELGALFGAWVSRWTGLDARQQRILVASAAGAGLAGVYNAPLAGALFAVELLLGEVSVEAMAVAMAASAVASLIASPIEGGEPFYHLPALDSSWSLAVAALLAGPLFGLIGHCFAAGASWAGRHRPRGKAILWTMPAMFAFTGVVAVAFPEMMGNGRAIVQAAVNFGSGGSLPGLGFLGDLGVMKPGWGEASFAVVVGGIGLLCLFVVLKGALTTGSILSGASGGTLTPSLALGAAAGAAVGALWSLWWPGSSVAAFAVVGGAAVLAAAQQAPLVAIAFALELTGAPLVLLVPMGIAVFGATFTQRALAERGQRPHGARSLL